MSNKEQIVKLLDRVPEYKMGYILAYVQGITADEEADDFFVKKWLKIICGIPIRKRIKNTHWKNVKKCGALINVSNYP